MIEILLTTKRLLVIAAHQYRAGFAKDRVATVVAVPEEVIGLRLTMPFSGKW